MMFVRHYTSSAIGSSGMPQNLHCRLHIHERGPVVSPSPRRLNATVVPSPSEAPNCRRVQGSGKGRENRFRSIRADCRDSAVIAGDNKALERYKNVQYCSLYKNSVRVTSLRAAARERAARSGIRLGSSSYHLTSWRGDTETTSRRFRPRGSPP